MIARTAAQYNALPERSKDVYDRMIKVIGRMKKDTSLSLRQATRPSVYDPKAPDKAIDPRTVLRLGGSALKKVNGQYVAKQRDNLLRMLPVPMRDDVEEIAVLGSAPASTLGQYWAALQKAIRPGGDPSALMKFQRRTIKDASGTQIPFLTDLRVLKDLARAGLLSFETIYRRGV